MVINMVSEQEEGSSHFFKWFYSFAYVAIFVSRGCYLDLE